MLPDRGAALMTDQINPHETGTTSSHCAQVRIAMASLNSEPGLV